MDKWNLTMSYHKQNESILDDSKSENKIIKLSENKMGE